VLTKAADTRNKPSLGKYVNLCHSFLTILFHNKLRKTERKPSNVGSTKKQPLKTDVVKNDRQLSINETVNRN